MKAQHGGARVGSGRKKLYKVLVSYRLPRDVAEFLREEEEPAGVVVERAVRVLMRCGKADDHLM